MVFLDIELLILLFVFLMRVWVLLWFSVGSVLVSIRVLFSSGCGWLLVLLVFFFGVMLMVSSCLIILWLWGWMKKVWMLVVMMGLMLGIFSSCLMLVFISLFSVLKWWVRFLVVVLLIW